MVARALGRLREQAEETFADWAERPISEVMDWIVENVPKQMLNPLYRARGLMGGRHHHGDRFEPHNNLPMGLIAATTTQAAQLSHHVTGAVLIGVDLGPNLSVIGSLATILWLIALRREGEHVGALRFLRLGVLVMPPALLLSLLALSLIAA